MRGIILSAGLGERLRPLTNLRAKPAIEFLNMPMLSFPYFWLSTLNLSDLVFNTHYLPESVRHAAMHVVSPSIGLHFTHEPSIMGSGGGIWNARAHLNQDEAFAVANADGVILSENEAVLTDMLEFHLSKGALATLLVCPSAEIGEARSGVWMDSFGEVVNFGKAKAKSYAEGFHYASYMLLSRRIWNYLPEGSSNILYDVLEPLIAQGEKVFGYRVDDLNWFETGNIQDYLAATKTCLELIRDDHPLGRRVLKILDRHAPSYQQRSDKASLRLIADQANLGEALTINGFCVIGDGSSVGTGCHLENVVVLPQAHAAPGKSIANQVITCASG